MASSANFSVTFSICYPELEAKRCGNGQKFCWLGWIDLKCIYNYAMSFACGRARCVEKLRCHMGTVMVCVEQKIRVGHCCHCSMPCGMCRNRIFLSPLNSECSAYCVPTDPNALLMQENCPLCYSKKVHTRVQLQWNPFSQDVARPGECTKIHLLQRKLVESRCT